ncbi:MAG: hypothetical protein H7210_13805 [Pyrinomonadaceae bacterium]|nr:hypothetical protein [Phycisphaerales bacterium]
MTKTSYLSTLLYASMGMLAGSAHAQIFTVLPEGPAAPAAWVAQGPRPVHGCILSVDAPGLSAALAKAPAQRLDEQLATYGLPFSLPDPAGAMIPCVVAESPVMEPPLQKKFPHIRTYIVQSLDRNMTGRLEVSPRGITAMLRSAIGESDGHGSTGSAAWMIDPWNSADPLHAVSYWLRDLPGGDDWICETTEGVHGFATPAAHEHAGRGGVREAQVLRTVRAAIACTGEYGAYQCQIQGHAPNTADPLAAIVTTISRVNVVYEIDLAMHFNLVANNDQIVFINPATDPYPSTCDGTGGGSCSGAYLAPNIQVLANVIGNANFDIGHLLTRVYGGVSYLSSVCSSNKAGGISGIPRGGDVDAFSFIVVSHEMGHQFGASHTFSGTRGRCAGNVSLSTAWEAGGGTSPMGYAGGCPVGDAPPSDNLVLFSDPFFHLGSLREMRSFLFQATCPVQTVTANTIPVLEPLTGVGIPPGTPFILTAAASDLDGDVLTYSWEQLDSGAARPISGNGAVDNGQGSLFRIFPPVLSPQRTFPKMSDILSGVPTPGERLPTVTGVNRQFRVVVRDNHAGAGGAAVSDPMYLTIPPGTSPFGVVTPAHATTLHAGLNAVTWTVGGTNEPPISADTVTIWLSTDNGATFTQNLGTFANQGDAIVTLPHVTATARIRVGGTGKIFFAISRPFTLRAPCAADYNYDGSANTQDFFDFLGTFFANAATADFNHDERVTSQDFFDFLAAFFAGC